jgi:hypothetical protein
VAPDQNPPPIGRHQHRSQRAGVHLREIFEAAFRSDVIADGSDDVVATEDNEIENETESEGADFVWCNVDDFFDNALHTKALSS